MSRTTQMSVEDLFKRLGGTAMTRRARADSLFRRLRETDEDAFLGTFIRAPKKAKSAPDDTKPQS
ncbi:MAG: hypothetical protein KDD85_04075 [Parvularculaceae bacterium]|nr:hypothetical protein [Parvularculaceae bacterium]